MPSSELWKLRRLAPRARRVVERRKGESLAIAAYAPQLEPAASRFITAYDQAARFEATWKREMQEGRSAAQQVQATMRAWLPLVQRDVPGFSSRGFCDSPQVPDDLIEDASRLHDLVSDHRGPDGQPLPYATDCCATLDGVLRAATRELDEAEAADKGYQQLLAEVRAAAAAFDANLQPFRRTLAAAVGRQDKDYQKLRSQRAHAADPDDDPAAPPPQEETPPAAPGVSQPTGPTF